MPARVIFVAGPLQGQEFVIGQSGLRLGRSNTNDIALDEASVSRHHCSIQPSPEGILITDHGSHNHTWVNGARIQQQVLRTGDQICVGGSKFYYLDDEASLLDVRAYQQTCADSASNTMVLRREDALYLQPHEQIDAAGSTDRSLQAIKLLLQVVEAMAPGGTLQALTARLLEMVSQVLPITAAGIVLADENEQTAFAWPLSINGAPPPALPNAVLRRVIDERISICTSDILAEGVVEPTKSVVASPVRSMIAVPVIADSRVIGVLHGAAGHAAFTPEHLQLMTGVAAMAAPNLGAALRLQRVEKENQRLQQQIRRESNLVGNSPQMLNLQAMIAKVAPASSTVLIAGESGTGKELVAAAIHRNSPRAAKPFVAINCAALTETLLESELFGHEKGSFTGAVVQKRGKFEEADGGTIFLDEVGELAQGIQAKLLRVLQERTVTRVGGSRELQVDVRVIAATNRDLYALVRSGGFRQDLYFRLNVISIQTPPLRERVADIPLLVDHFLSKHSRNAQRRMAGVSPRTLQILARYDWPGNVRELENIIERALVLGSTEYIVPEDLPETLLESSSSEETATTFHERVNEAKRAIIGNTLQSTEGSVTDAARQLGIHPNNLHRLIRNLGIKLPAK